MRIDQELKNHIRQKLNAEDERLIAERESERREAMSQAAARGLANSGGIVTAIIQVYKNWLSKRVAMYFEIYRGTLEVFSIPVDLCVQNEIESELTLIANLNYQIQLPDLSLPDPMQYQAHIAREMKSAGHASLWSAKNHLRELRMKSERGISAPESQKTERALYSVSGDNARVYVNSSDHSTNIYVHEANAGLDALVRLSKETQNTGALAHAEEAKAAFPDKGKTLESVSRWLSVASTSANLMHSAGPYLTAIYNALSKI